MLLARAGFASILLVGVVGTHARAQTEIEPNDTCATTVTLVPGHYGPYQTYNTYDPNHHWDFSDPDWLRVVVPPQHHMLATVTRTSSTTVPLCELHVGSGTGTCPNPITDNRVLIVDGQSTVFQTWNTTAQAVDTYFLIDGWVVDWGVVALEYTIDVVVVPIVDCATTPDDRFEVGPGIAVPIAPGVHTGLFASLANDDQYTLRVPAGATIRVAIDFVHVVGDLDLQLSDGSAGYQSNGTTDQESIVYTAPPPAAFRDVVLRVRPKATPAPACNDYALSIDVLQQAVGTTTCEAGTNGYGTAARMLSSGTSSISANSLSFVCQAFPATNAGILIGSWSPTHAPFGDGYRCVAGTVHRFGASSASNGVATYPLDLASGQGLAVGPGSTWYFQVFYRDQTLPGGAGFNLTDSVSITMTP